MKNISLTIAKTLWNQGVIQKEDIDACRYGLEVFISSTLEIVSILIIAIFARNFFESFLFFLMFTPLRVFAGGYHANTKVRCYFVSLGVYGIFTLILKILPQKIYRPVNLVTAIFSVIVVLILSPVIHKNRSVDKIEKENYRKISIMISLVETAVILLLTVVHPSSKYIIAMSLGMCAVAFTMIAGMLKAEKMIRTKG